MVNIRDFNEREFHPFVTSFLKKEFGIASKTIRQEVTKSGVKGENEWVHADIVGFTLPVLEYNEGVMKITEHYNLPKVIMYSYELKKEITMGTLRQVFFQAVSNSSWANEGYLVTIDLDEEDDRLMQTINRLSNSFGIGVIKIDVENVEKSRIVFEAKHKETIDWDFVNHLYEINSDFQLYFRAIEDSLKIRRFVYDDLDKVLSQDVLNKILNKSNTTQSITTTQTVQLSTQTSVPTLTQTMLQGIPQITTLQPNPNTNTTTVVPSEFYLDWNNPDSSFTKVVSLEIEDVMYDVKNWKDVFVNIVEFFYKKDKSVVIDNLKNRNSKSYLSTTLRDLRTGKAIHTGDNSPLYVETHFSSANIVSLIDTLIESFSYSADSIKIKLSKSKDN